MKIVSLLAIILSFTQCGSTKLEKKPPFTITSATYTNWVGGQPGVSGTRVEIHLNEKSEIIFDSLFFNKRSRKLEISNPQNKTILIGHFSNSTRNNTDFILDSDRRKELKNSIPKLKKLPFELKENEAMISYIIDGKTFYFKIENVEKAAPDMYPKIQ